MKKLMAFICLSLLLGCSPERPYLQTLKLNREGGKALQGQKYSEAQVSFLEALRFDPFRAGLHLNLGLTFEGLQQAEKAQQSYQESSRLADQHHDKPVQFLARYNEGQLLGKAKKVDEALARYQAALEINPDSVETKHNIELLISSLGGQGQGESDSQDQKDKQGQQNKDQKGQGQGNSKDQKDSKDPKDSKDQKDSKDGDDQKKEKPQERQASPKYVPRQFNGKELSEGDVKKILGELKQQEGRIRSDYNKKDGKEQPRDKDW